MARTAPIPNIPAIPGMNPGVWVLGGGAGGGGGSGDGSGGDGEQGAGGENGGDGAEGGGPNAGSCGPGSGSGCPNPAHGGGGGTQAGDPIDPVTGRMYTLAVTDLPLPGPLPLMIERAYSSATHEEDVGLGFGWSHSLAWRIEETRRGLRVFAPFAGMTKAQKPLMGASARLPCGTLLRTEAGYALEAHSVTFVFCRSDAARGVFRLSRIVDTNSNRIQLEYGEAGLEAVSDSAGRSVRVKRNPDFRIRAFEVKNAATQGVWTALRTYEYDERGDLSAAVDALGYAERYTYDNEHRMLTRSTPAGLVVETRYDDEGRCVETFCRRVIGDDGLDDAAPALLANGTKAKGFMHVVVDHSDGCCEVATSRSVRRVEGNAFGKADKIVWAGAVHTQAFDKAGEIVSYCDGDGNTWRWKRDDAGRLLETMDPLGAVTAYSYDERGLLAESTDAEGGVVRYVRDESGKPTLITDGAGMVAQLRYDERGQLIEAVMPNGGVTKMAYDERGNRIEIVEPDGAVRRIRYDYLGRALFYVDERGNTVAYGYDAQGRLCMVRGPSGATSSYEYDADGDLTRIVDADGRATTLVRGGFHVVTALIRPDGSRVRYFYDREQDLSRIENEAGEEHRFERDLEGRIRAEHTFDGRRLGYRRDLQGRVVQLAYDDGEVTEFTYDACGRVIERKHADDRVDTFEYDLLGRVAAASSGDASCRYVRDLRGNIVREETTLGDTKHIAEATYDKLGKRTSLRSSTGLFADTQQDVAGRPIELSFGDSAPLAIRYDPAGIEIERLLPGGGRVATELDPDGRPRRVAVLAAKGRKRSEGEPIWVGPAGGDETLLQQFEWSPGGDLRSLDVASEGLTRYEHDASGRVTRRSPPKGSEERYQYGETGDLYDDARMRRYGPGGRLSMRDGVTYRHDARGRLVEKQVDGPDGKPRIVRFEWRADGLLQSVVSPDGERVDFAYDPFARRLQKTVTKGRTVVAKTDYAWAGATLLQSEEHTFHDDGTTSVEERSYAYVPGTIVPAAQRLRRDGEDAPWQHVLQSRVNLFPDALLDGDGKVRTRITSRLFGKADASGAEATDLRFPGQLADKETGLFDNRFRAYDPETATFLSPEPLGLEGGLMAYAYARNRPLRYVDPDGLAPAVVTSTVTGSAGSFPVASGAGNVDRPLHPAVAAALPVENARAPYPDGGVHPTTHCGDPHAFSDYLNAWEGAQNPPRRCDPSTPEGRAALGDALGSISSFQSNQTGRNPGPRAPCPNCSQTISRLYGLANMPPPGADVMQPGRLIDPTQNGIYESPQAGSALAASQAGGGGRDPREANAPAGTVPNPGTFNHDAQGNWGPR